MKILRKFLIGLGVVLLVVAVGFFAILPAIVDSNLNPVTQRDAVDVPARVRELHQSLLIADLHADSLLWDRNLVRRNSRGHVDLPRLQEGNVALQVFTTVTQSPRGLNLNRNEPFPDDITPLMFAQLRPPSTWRSRTARSLHQAKQLRELSERSSGELVLITSRAELERFLAARIENPRLTGALLGIEGAHALDQRLENLDRLFAAGFRMMSPAHFFDNEFGGSAHGVRKGGLNARGREMVARMEQMGMVVDLAHSSPATFNDVLAIAKRPVVVSHTGVRGTCNSPRNLSDAQVRAVAQNGGLIGIGYWHAAVCGADAQAIARAMRYAVNHAGVNHVALGSDFDGAVRTPFDTAGLSQLTAALLAAGFSEAEIRKIMGENAMRFFLRNLP